MITAIVLVVATAVLVILNGLNSCKLVASQSISRLVVAGSILAAALGGFLIFDTIYPAAPSVEGELKKDGDVIDLGSVSGGVLYLEAKMLDGVEKPGLAFTVRMIAKGKDGKQPVQANFQLGESGDDIDNPTVSDMGINIGLKALGESTGLKVTKMSNAGLASVHVAYRPYRLPFFPLLIALFVLVVLASAYEGAAPAGWQRSFLTVTVSSVAAFVWLLENGLTSDDSGWTIWIRVAYAIVIGAVVGTLLPALVGRFMPELEAPSKKGAEPEPSTDETTAENT